MIRFDVLYVIHLIFIIVIIFDVYNYVFHVICSIRNEVCTLLSDHMYSIYNAECTIVRSPTVIQGMSLAGFNVVILTHLCRPVRSTFAVVETASLGIMGAPRVPPLNPSESIVLSSILQRNRLMHYALVYRPPLWRVQLIVFNKTDLNLLLDMVVNIVYFRGIVLRY